MPLTLAEKLAEAGAAIGDLAKEGDNGSYTYLRAFDVFKALRRELFNRGVVIIPVAVLAVERTKPYETISGNIIDETRVSVRYKITDGVEEVIGEGVGVGQDYRGKSLYKALTGSLKYFLQSLGLITGIPDDPDEEAEQQFPEMESIGEKLDEMERKYGSDLNEHPISQRDVRAFNSLCRTTGISERGKKDFLKEKFGIDKISDLKRKHRDQAIRWAKDEKESNEAPGVDTGVE